LNEVYPDEAFVYSDLITEREVRGYLMQATIAQNPHSKSPKDLFEDLDQILRQFDDREVEIDREGLQGLKQKLATLGGKVKAK